MFEERIGGGQPVIESELESGLGFVARGLAEGLDYTDV